MILNVEDVTFTFSRRFYPKRLTLHIHSGYTYFCQYMLTEKMIDRPVYSEWSFKYVIVCYDMILYPKVCLLFYYTLKRVHFFFKRPNLLKGRKLVAISTLGRS